MSDNTGIGWTNATWNTLSGCTRASAECDNCYAVQMSYRLERMGQQKYTGLTVLNPKGDRHFNGVVKCHREALEVPFGWKKPKRVFVNSMSDTFHKAVPFPFVAEMFTTMAQTTRHSYQVLTKRPERLHEFYQWNYPAGVVEPDFARADWLGSWPNVWFGTSIGVKATLDRARQLCMTPGVVRFLSIEPLLEDLGDIRPYLRMGINWVIVGVESDGRVAGRLPGGSEAGYWDAAASLIGQCRELDIPVFHKQAACAGLVSTEMDEWPEPMRVRQFPKVVPA